MTLHRFFAALLFVVMGCGSSSTVDGGTDATAAPDLGGDTGPTADLGTDFGPPVVASTAHCTYAAAPGTAGAGGMVTDGPVSAGVADRVFDIPVGTTLGAYTARAVLIGGMAHQVDHRIVEQSGGSMGFNPSVGIETRPHVHALALTVGTETVVILRTDFALSYDGILHEIENNLGPTFAGKVIFATSHSHSMFAQYTGNSALGVGLGAFRRAVFDEIVSTSTDAAMAALAARAPAQIGFAHDGSFDLANMVTHDRRGENDVIAGGSRKDHDLFVIRVDTMAGAPLAVAAIFGIHGTIMDADNPLASAEAPGYVERAIEESFDSDVLVMHLQGAAGDVSPGGSGGLHIDSGPGYSFPRLETVGLYARDAIMAAWTSAGSSMVATTKMEMLTRSIELGPNWATFDLRAGALAYAPFDIHRRADRMIFAADGTTVLSPIDEFNAPVGAALCGNTSGVIGGPPAIMPGTSGLVSYGSCSRLDGAAPTLSLEIGINFEGFPICASTRTTVSALRIGSNMFVVIPGEPLTMLQDYVRMHPPAGFDTDHTAVIGYSQGHVGYVLTPEDWLQGGYEPSINFWGPLEGEYIANQALAVAGMAATDTREDGEMGAATRWVTPAGNGDSIDVPPPDAHPSSGYGLPPATVPSSVYVFGGVAPSQAQPVATVPRLGTATFTWVGEDPMEATPRITVQRETSTPDTFVDLTRRSGRVVDDGDFLLTWTPDPLVRATPTSTRTHYWAAEWQAVTPRGAAGTTDAMLAARFGLPLGRYRFHVVGSGYTLDSDPFTVTSATLTTTATRTGGNIAVTTSYDAAGGFRLLDMNLDSNGVIPLHSGPVTVELLGVAGVVLSTTTVTTGADGSASVPDMVAALQVRVTDAYGNVGTSAI